MGSIFENHGIFRKNDAGWGPGPPRRRIEITPAIYLLENYHCDREVRRTFVGIHVLCPSACHFAVAASFVIFGSCSFCGIVVGICFWIVVVAWFLTCSLHFSRWYQLCGGGRGVCVVMLAGIFFQFGISSASVVLHSPVWFGSFV